VIGELKAWVTVFLFYKSCSASVCTIQMYKYSNVCIQMLELWMITFNSQICDYFEHHGSFQLCISHWVESKACSLPYCFQRYSTSILWSLMDDLVMEQFKSQWKLESSIALCTQAVDWKWFLISESAVDFKGIKNASSF
jgi:hypothetical protein